MGRGEGNAKGWNPDPLLQILSLNQGTATESQRLDPDPLLQIEHRYLFFLTNRFYRDCNYSVTLRLHVDPADSSTVTD
jgi:hypothetical protein